MGSDRALSTRHVFDRNHKLIDQFQARSFWKLLGRGFEEGRYPLSTKSDQARRFILRESLIAARRRFVPLSPDPYWREARRFVPRFAARRSAGRARSWNPWSESLPPLGRSQPRDGIEPILAGRQLDGNRSIRQTYRRTGCRPNRTSARNDLGLEPALRRTRPVPPSWYR